MDGKVYRASGAIQVENVAASTGPLRGKKRCNDARGTSSVSSWLFWSSIVSGVVATWSYGIMHNHAMAAAKRRPGFSGRFYDITEREADSAPNWLAALNMLSSLAPFVLLIAATFINVTN